jgi:hypothetical protein
VGRLFWKFFAFVWLAQLVGIIAVGSLFWLTDPRGALGRAGPGTSRRPGRRSRHYSQSTRRAAMGWVQVVIQATVRDPPGAARASTERYRKRAPQFTQARSRKPQCLDRDGE